MIHKTFARFWKYYEELPKDIQEVADRNYELLKSNSRHPSLHFKKISGKEELWSVRVGDSYRALGLETVDNEITWFWIGPHADYDKRI